MKEQYKTPARKLSSHFLKKFPRIFLCENQFQIGRKWSILLLIKTHFWTSINLIIINGRCLIQNCNRPSANACQSESMGNVVRIMYSTCSFPSPVDYSTPRGRCSDHPVQVNSVITLAIDQVIACQNKNKLSMSWFILAWMSHYVNL